jgi:Fe2+ transport system protein FeoA
MPGDETLPLSSLRPGQRAVVSRVNNDEDSNFLRHMTNLGLMPGAQLTVADYSPFDNNLTVQVSGMPPVVLGLAVTYKVFVELLPD